MVESSSRFIPNYLTAKSLTGLRRAMLLNNSKKGYFFKYFDIQKVTERSQEVWVAFYYEEVRFDNVDQLDKELGGE